MSVTETQPLRKHQARALEVVDRIVGGKVTKKVITADITPGGGKTLMASLFAHALEEAGVIERVLVIVPNVPLRDQMVSSFHDPGRGLTGHLRWSGRQSTLPGAGRAIGQAQTYQLLSNPKKARKFYRWCAEKPTLVIFDECHHLCEAEHKAWAVGARTVVEGARLVLCMSGTITRGDKKAIPFIEYDSGNRAIVDIAYPRHEALEEGAVLPVEFRCFDAEVTYEHRRVEHRVELSAATDDEQSRALKTALVSRDYVETAIGRALGEWETFRAQRDYPSSAIVVCHNKTSARIAFDIVRSNFSKYRSGISIDGDPQADKMIERFRRNELNILITIRKAYEGLDVPSATHLVYLGNIRTHPFLDQVIARVTRVDRRAHLPASEQRAFVYVPNDPPVHQYVRNMLNEQAPYFEAHEKCSRDGVADFRGASTFRPGGAELTKTGSGVDGRMLTDAQHAGAERVRAMNDRFRTWGVIELLALAERMGFIPEAAE